MPLKPAESKSPTVAELDRTCRDLVRTGRELSPDRERVIDVLDRVSAMWLDHQAALRRTTEGDLALATGYSRPVVGAAIDHLFRSASAPALRALAEAEAPSLPVRRPELVLHVTAGTVFPPTIVGPMATLLLGRPCLVKPASRVPVLPIRWARSIASIDPGLGSMVSVVPWSRRRTELTACALRHADTAVIHGDDDTIARIAALAPPGTHLVRHGHKISAALVTARAAADQIESLSHGLAEDIALYDQQGCLSPQMVIFIEDAELTADAFAQALARALADAAERFPRGTLTPARASALRQAVDARELEVYAAGGRRFGGLDRGYVVFTLSAGEPRFEWSPGGRVVVVRGIADEPTGIALLRTVTAHLQAVAVAGSNALRRRLDRALNGPAPRWSAPGRDRPVWICRPGELAAPPINWSADGYRPLASQCPPS